MASPRTVRRGPGQLEWHARLAIKTLRRDQREAIADAAGTCYATGDRKWSSGESRYNGVCQVSAGHVELIRNSEFSEDTS